MKADSKVKIVHGVHEGETGKFLRFRTKEERSEWREDADCHVALDDDWSPYRVFPRHWLKEVVKNDA